MEPVYPSDKIYIADSPISGLGVFAKDKIKKGEVIEKAPVLLIPEDQLTAVTKSKLIDYYFAWGNGFKQAAIGLGYASLYNHSYTPNARYSKDLDKNILTFIALEDIDINDEITANYNGDPDDKTKMWFLAREERQ